LEIDACFPDSIVGFIPYPPIKKAHFFHYFVSTFKSNLEQYAPETAQKNINLTILRQVAVPLPPLEEMEEITRVVGRCFRIADRVEQQIIQAESRVEKLTQSILAKAFRGELVN